jgi:RNase H-fold protein (predicted Holliday junction resolvase)
MVIIYRLFSSHRMEYKKKPRIKNILSIDYGTKYVWVAYRNERNGMTTPVGTLYNDESLFFNIWAILKRYYIGTVVVWYPKQHKTLQAKIDAFVEQLVVVDDSLLIVKTDEEYTSIQAGAVLGTFEKSLAEDTVAAMVILEEYIKKQIWD